MQREISAGFPGFARVLCGKALPFRQRVNVSRLRRCWRRSLETLLTIAGMAEPFRTALRRSRDSVVSDLQPEIRACASLYSRVIYFRFVFNKT